MPGKAVGRAAVDLPWLCPNTISLVGLAEDPANLAPLAFADPALFTFLVRFALGEAGSPFAPPTDKLLSSTLPETAASFLSSTALGWLNPGSFTVRSINEIAHRAAGIARALAEKSQRIFPEAAETAARLAPLGWFAVLACDKSVAAACLHDPAFLANPAGCQVRHWELDNDAIARRLAGRWKLPTWLAAIVGWLNSPFEAAVQCGADPDLFAVVSLAVHEAEASLANLGLTHGIDRSRILDHLGFDESIFGSLRSASAHFAVDDVASRREFDPNPHRMPLMVKLLRGAALTRRRSAASLVVRLEERIDELHRSATTLAELAGNRLRDAKLTALAEFAAGAGHEINNPLAVISGNAQRLIRTEQDDDRAESLRCIVRQSQRISGILRELMQFARPPKLERDSILVLTLVNSLCEELFVAAEERGVRLELVNAAADVRLHADPRQVRTALAAVVRNALEATGFGGWVRLHCSREGTGVRFTIEDNGPGLTPDAAEHAFDPFYSGRIAGRGRGLGLSTAWQLTRHNGGDLRHEATVNGPTRFVMTFPAAEFVEFPQRRSA